MDEILKEFGYAGHWLRQIWRQGDVAVYERSLRKDKTPHELELICIAIEPEGRTPSGSSVPEREAYPRPSQWGRLAWSFPVRYREWVLELAEKLVAIKSGRGSFVRQATSEFKQR